ncbi:NAD-dependent epimerase/dehydratase family protein [Duganella levis]|uniref:NAD-dependent epimerase/dehydratase family protein n=1 Tax=Duganella levis TaxID=2692169 RepID=A0ABW9W566_9BURK|nr:NAD(P)-dependent oxidoreductase [Duganella levis]MYN29071.1 NAD-dependent epimerase/dehydratase family protein [Duganella levis]
MKYKTCVIFGGTGFIGSHLALHLLETGQAERIVLADIAPPRADFSFDATAVQYLEIDVRKPILAAVMPAEVDLIVNLAAVHREPGHAPHEYYETNLLGAENVCAWAEQIGCNNLIFTSSIAPYGPTESVKTEQSIPVPMSPYGGSKLAAEKIHLRWQHGAPGRRLVIVRPGVVFGPGERGNVTRLVQATMRRYFLYMGNRATRKAGGYVKELVITMLWALERLPADGGHTLYNFTMQKPPSIEEYVHTVCDVAAVKRVVPSIPYPLLLGISYVIEAVARPLGIKQPVSPVRIRKLVRSNNIEPALLLSEQYPYRYTLQSAMSDWRHDRPDEWR